MIILNRKNLKLGLFNFYRRDERFGIGNLIKISGVNYCKMILLLVFIFFLGLQNMHYKTQTHHKITERDFLGRSNSSLFYEGKKLWIIPVMRTKCILFPLFLSFGGLSRINYQSPKNDCIGKLFLFLVFFFWKCRVCTENSFIFFSAPGTLCTLKVLTNFCVLKDYSNLTV